MNVRVAIGRKRGHARADRPNRPWRASSVTFSPSALFLPFYRLGIRAKVRQGGDIERKGRERERGKGERDSAEGGNKVLEGLIGWGLF